jgi:hypothetical protein
LDTGCLITSNAYSDFEVKILTDDLSDKTENLWIVICGGFNAEFDEVPLDPIQEKVENIERKTARMRDTAL